MKDNFPNIQTKNQIIQSCYPNALWQCDLIGRIPNLEGQNRYILVAIDHYSKWEKQN